MADTPTPSLVPELSALLAPLGGAGRASVAAAGQGVRQRVLARVQASVQAHAEYLTVRRDQGPWLPQTEGVRARRLREDAQTAVDIVALDAGAELPWPEGVLAQEILVVGGGLAESGAGAAAAAAGEAPVARAYLHRVRFRGADAPRLLAEGSATAYVRHLRVPPGELPPLEARWWTQGATGWVTPAGRRWRPTAAGVEVMPLRGDAEVVSMLVRFAAGASVADHHHALNEDCLVLEGEMFLGDILLRAGDYQLAPAGGGHFGECSDVGVLFFFHGALDPVLRGEAQRGEATDLTLRGAAPAAR